MATDLPVDLLTNHHTVSILHRPTHSLDTPPTTTRATTPRPHTKVAPQGRHTALSHPRFALSCTLLYQSTYPPAIDHWSGRLTTAYDQRFIHLRVPRACRIIQTNLYSMRASLTNIIISMPPRSVIACCCSKIPAERLHSRASSADAGRIGRLGCDRFRSSFCFAGRWRTGDSMDSIYSESDSGLLGLAARCCEGCATAQAPWSQRLYDGARRALEAIH